MPLDNGIPSPPAVPGLDWRPLLDEDTPAICGLTQACLNVDGGLPLAAGESFVRSRYLRCQPRGTIGAFHANGQLAAVSAVQPALSDRDVRLVLVGYVHPAYRRRGIGGFLLQWSLAQAQTLLQALPGDRARAITLATESWTEAAERLYTTHGFVRQFAEDVMVHDEKTPLPDVHAPGDVMLASWSDDVANLFADAYQASFRDRPGFPGWSKEQWIAWITDDDEFRPEASLLALREGLPIGFIVCADAWITQVGVRPEWRRQGVASALVVEALGRLRDLGFRQVWLDVNVNNPGAARVYSKLGFAFSGRRARYGLAEPAIEREG